MIMMTMTMMTTTTIIIVLKALGAGYSRVRLNVVGIGRAVKGVLLQQRLLPRFLAIRLPPLQHGLQQLRQALPRLFNQSLLTIQSPRVQPRLLQQLRAQYCHQRRVNSVQRQRQLQDQQVRLAGPRETQRRVRRQ